MFSIRYIFLVFIIFLYSNSSFSQRKQEIDYVNSYIGTAEKGEGGLALSVGPPFTMTNFSPQTCENKISRMYYVYEDTSILGFISSHQSTVWMGDYGYVSVMPETGSLKLKPKDRKLSFSHEEEIATPYYYSVKMKTDEKKIIKAEIAATERCGIFRFTFPESKNSHLVFQSINIDDEKDDDGINSKENRANKITAYIKFDKAKNQIIGYNPDRASFDIGPELKNF